MAYTRSPILPYSRFPLYGAPNDTNGHLVSLLYFPWHHLPFAREKNRTEIYFSLHFPSFMEAWIFIAKKEESPTKENVL